MAKASNDTTVAKKAAARPSKPRAGGKPPAAKADAVARGEGGPPVRGVPLKAAVGKQPVVRTKAAAGKQAPEGKQPPGGKPGGVARQVPIRGQVAAGKRPGAGRVAHGKAAPAKTTPAKTTPAKTKSAKATPAKAASSRGVSGKAPLPAAARNMPSSTMPLAKASSGRVAAARAVIMKAAPRRSPAEAAATAPPARRARLAAPHKRSQPPLGPARSKPPQRFTVSHLNEADFKSDGLRAYAQYRDLGVAGATSGLCQAHVIRFVPPCTEAVRKSHRHAADLQLVYVLKGWMKNAFAGIGEQMMSTGSCWLQPSGIEHTVLDYSADCEVLEIVVPADFGTEELG